MGEFEVVLESILLQLPEVCKNLNEKIAEIVKTETTAKRAEEMAIREAQKFTNEILDRLEGAR